MPRSGALALALLLAGCAPRTPSPPLPQPHRDSALESQLRALASQVDGDVGIYVHHFASGRTAELNADELFPTASMIKVPIMLATYQAIHDGRLSFDSVLTYTDSLDYDDEADSIQAGIGEPLALGGGVGQRAIAWVQTVALQGLGLTHCLVMNGISVDRCVRIQ